MSLFIPLAHHKETLMVEEKKTHLEVIQFLPGIYCVRPHLLVGETLQASKLPCYSLARLIQVLETPVRKGLLTQAAADELVAEARSSGLVEEWTVFDELLANPEQPPAKGCVLTAVVVRHSQEAEHGFSIPPLPSIKKSEDKRTN